MNMCHACHVLLRCERQQCHPISCPDRRPMSEYESIREEEIAGTEMVKILPKSRASVPKVNHSESLRF